MCPLCPRNEQIPWYYCVCWTSRVVRELSDFVRFCPRVVREVPQTLGMSAFFQRTTLSASVREVILLISYPICPQSIIFML